MIALMVRKKQKKTASDLKMKIYKGKYIYILEKNVYWKKRKGQPCHFN